MSGGVNDPDEIIVGAFKAFDEEGIGTLCLILALQLLFYILPFLSSRGEGERADHHQTHSRH